MNNFGAPFSRRSLIIGAAENQAANANRLHVVQQNNYVTKQSLAYSTKFPVASVCLSATIFQKEREPHHLTFLCMS